MLKTLKFKGPETSFFWVSDTHFNHDKPWIVQVRGYQSVKEHDEDLIKKWNEKVTTTDTVFHLGDFYLYSNKAEDSLNVIRRLNFDTLILLWGNHNASLRQLYEDEIKSQYGVEGIEVYPLTKYVGAKKIVFIGNYLEAFINNEHFVMNHFSQRSWHKNGKGSFMLCAHSHGNDKGINKECLDSKILDVGVDNFGGPVSLAEIKRIMNAKQIKVTDHH